MAPGQLVGEDVRGTSRGWVTHRAASQPTQPMTRSHPTTRRGVLPASAERTRSRTVGSVGATGEVGGSAVAAPTRPVPSASLGSGVLPTR